jgi:hypothetical protein
MKDFALRNGETVMVDDDSAQLMRGLPWNIDSKGTVGAMRRDPITRQPRRLLLSVFLMGEAAPRGWAWIHADGEWRNFQRDNLKLVQMGKHHSRAFGAMSPDELAAVSRRGGQRAREHDPSTLKPRGVHASGKKFRAMATVNGKQTYLGLYPTREDAARAYDAALISQGLKAVNFPSSVPHTGKGDSGLPG